MEQCHPSPISCIHKKEKNIPEKKQEQFIAICEFSKIGEREYDSKKNFFDPNKNSPTNDFMIKLYKRFYHFNEISSHVYKCGMGGGDDNNSEIFFESFIKK